MTDWTMWQCQAVGVSRKTGELKPIAKRSPHTLPPGEQPDQPTTDASGRMRFGQCKDCGRRTVWQGLR